MDQDSEANRKREIAVYTSCLCNCGNNSQCIFKAHIKDGKVIRVEPDDRYHPNVGREDEVLSDEDIIKTRLQRRPCTKGLVFHKYISQTNRILHPLKKSPGSERGEGKYVRISWDEAFSTITEKLKEAKDKYGPYSMIVPFHYTPVSQGWVRIFELWGAGVDGWGWSSYDSIRLMAHIMTGVPGWEYPNYVSGSAADMLANSKLVVLWGFDPTMGSSGPGHQFAWYVKLARERGKRVIIIDPRYTTAAEVLADQWIPIKPGTDLAMFLAMAYVLFKEDLWDKEFVWKYVEPTGFKKWRDYILGIEDGTAKSPEWAEKICAIPAETIQELARLVATQKPAWLWCHWGVSRKSRGEQTAKGFAALQAILGYWGVPGAGPPLHLGPARDIPVMIPWGPPGTFHVPRMYRGHYWAQAVLLLDKVKRGELSEKEYMRMVGWRADPSLLKEFNPKIALLNSGSKPHGSDHLVTVTDSPNDQVNALNRMEFVVSMHSTMTSTTQYSDIVLPVQDWMWEEKNVVKSVGYGGFECINYCPGLVKPPGEAKPWVWIYIKLAEKLGINPREYFTYYTNDENWDRDWERYVMDSYQRVVDHYKRRNIQVPPWEEFIQGKFINCDELDEKPFTGWDEQVKKDKPFKTLSGKIEFYSTYVADESNRGKGEHIDRFGLIYENLPSDWGDLPPMPIYQPTVRGMDDPLVKKYPLMLLSPHPRYRVHYLFWEHPWLRDHVYRHRVWINPTDAKARGIKGEDKILVYNDRGKVVMPAYVTSRVMPGIVVLYHGGKYIPGESGIDFGASPSSLLGGDFESGTTPAKATTLVQVEKFKGGEG
jgi:anaerobic dimethyl sulfoxide reductase subunit A